MNFISNRDIFISNPCQGTLLGTSLILANCLKLTKKYITLAELRNSYEEEVAAFEAKSVGLLQVQFV